VISQDVRLEILANGLVFKISSLIRPLIYSVKPFPYGDPGSMQAVLVVVLASH
jgi:hypothetical protein